MTSGKTSSAPGDVTFVFLDANVVAKPVTRTLLMVGASRSGFVVGWSATAEAEAARHMRPNATRPADVRRRYGGELTPMGDVAGRFEVTDAKDRQLLADAEAAGARFIVTEDVDDYGLDDLASVGISAVNPDLFLAMRLTREAYSTVIQRFVELQVNPPTRPAQFHAAVAKNHPREKLGLFLIGQFTDKPPYHIRSGRFCCCCCAAGPATSIFSPSPATGSRSTFFPGPAAARCRSTANCCRCRHRSISACMGAR